MIPAHTRFVGAAGATVKVQLAGKLKEMDVPTAASDIAKIVRVNWHFTDPIAAQSAGLVDLFVRVDGPAAFDPPSGRHTTNPFAGLGTRISLRRATISAVEGIDQQVFDPGDL